MHEPNLNTPRRRQTRVPLASRDDSRWTAHAVVGMAHLVLGILSGISLLLMLANASVAEYGTKYKLLFYIVSSAIASVLWLLGGLWLADGRKVGARMVIAADALFVSMGVLNGDILTLSMVIYAGLGLAALNILPGLELDRRGD